MIVAGREKWFGFRLHMLSGVAYKMPKVSNSEIKETKIFKEYKRKNYEKLEKCIYFMTDKGYDKISDSKRYGKMWGKESQRNYWDGFQIIIIKYMKKRVEYTM